MTSKSWAIAQVLAAVMSCVASSVAWAESGSVTAFASLDARGQYFPTGPEEATFVGVLSGVVYAKQPSAELEASAVDAAIMMCPGTVTVDTHNAHQSGQAKCVITTPEGERIYGVFQCEGTYLEGCNGEFSFTGGTGKNAGISGGGPIQIKSALHQIAEIVPGHVIEQDSLGFAVFPKLTFSIPASGGTNNK